MSTFNLNGTSIYYEQSGSGPDLVFLHGYTCNLEDWRWTANALAERYRVLLFDLSCHGRSEKTGEDLNLDGLTEDTHAIIQGLGIEKPVLIGHSMGGMVALDFALRYPEEVRALVLAEAHTHIDTTARIIGSGVYDERTPREIVSQIDATMGEGGKYVTKSLFNSLMAFDVRRDVSALKMPVLFLWGDRYQDLSQAKLPVILQEFGYQQMPNLIAQYIPNAHHFVMLEQPGATLQAIQSFLQPL